LKKHSTSENQNNNISGDKEIKKLKECIEELEIVKNFQQDIIPSIKIIIGVDMSKKSLLETFLPPSLSIRRRYYNLSKACKTCCKNE